MSSSKEASTAHSSLFAGRRSTSGFFDEFAGKDGVPRAHWNALANSLDHLGRGELASRSENCRRILREHGVSCLVNRNGQSVDEPWQLDLLPFMIGATEWRELEA